MFIVDDVIGQAVSYLFKRVEASRDSHDRAISSIKVAMRGLSASFGDIIQFYEKCSHKLKRLLAANNMDRFWVFSDMLDEDKLRNFCNESGVCLDLRIAQDQFLQLPFGADSKSKALIEKFAYQLEAYEIKFIAAIREYFQKAENIDLIAATNSRDADPKDVLLVLDKCLEGLNKQKEKVDSVLQLIRDRAMRSWL